VRWGWLVGALVVAWPSTALAQEDEGTAISITGGLTTELEGSDANACVADDSGFRAHLTSLTTSTTILTFELRITGPGIFPVAAGNTVTLVSLGDNPDEFLINWNGSAGTVTISSLDAQVAGGEGAAPTRGATGWIDADLEDDGHEPVHVSGPWACHFPA
jgi:hypothetical protein